MLIRLAALALVAIAPTLAAPIPIAPDTAVLTGTVTDAETGDPLFGAGVYLPAFQRGAYTDVNGRYRINGAPVGRYNVQVLLLGYEIADLTEVDVVSGQTRTLDAALRIGEVLVEYDGPLYHHGPRPRARVVSRTEIRDRQSPTPGFYSLQPLPIGAGALTGIATDADTGDLLVGANVYVPAARRGGVTDIEGRYAIIFRAGYYHVDISHDGYAEQTIALRVGDQKQTILDVALQGEILGGEVVEE